MFNRIKTKSMLLGAMVIAASLHGASVQSPFSIAIIPDSQFYVNNSSKRSFFENQLSWIANNKAQNNIVYAIHVGDVIDTDDYSTEASVNEEFQYAHDQLEAKLTAYGIPYGIADGNNDVASPSSFSKFTTYFGSSHFTRYTWSSSDQKYRIDGNAFNVNGVQYGVVYLPWVAGGFTAGMLSEVKSQIQNNPSTRYIIVAHSILNPSRSSGYTKSDDGNGATVVSNLGDLNNVVLMVCGHKSLETYQSGIVKPTGAAYSIVQCDYQNYPNSGNGGVGYMRVVTMFTENDSIAVDTIQIVDAQAVQDGTFSDPQTIVTHTVPKNGGYGYIGNQFEQPLTIATIFSTTPPDGTCIYTYNEGGQNSFNGYTNTSTGWTPDASGLSIPSGYGFVVRSPVGSSADLQLNISGFMAHSALKNTVLNNTFPASGAFRCSRLMRGGRISTDLGFPATGFETIYIYDNVQAGYVSYFFDMFSQVWIPSEPVLQAGQAFIVCAATEKTWIQDEKGKTDKIDGGKCQFVGNQYRRDIKIDDIFMNDPAVGTALYTFNPGTNTYSFNTFTKTATGWNPDASGINIKPGEGYVIGNTGSTPIAVSTRGLADHGTLQNNIPQGYSLRCSRAWDQGLIQTDLGYNAPIGTIVYRYNSAGNNYTTYTLDDLLMAWDPAQPYLEYGQAVIILSPSPANWTQSN